MYRYSKYELLRKSFILLKNTRKKELRFFSTFWFIVKYLFHQMFYSKTVEIKISTMTFKGIYLRTHTSDLEVFLQHFVYEELIHPEITKLNKVNQLLDLGANIGLASLILSKIFPSATMIAIELEKNNFDLMVKNCQGLIDDNRLIPLWGAFLKKKDTKVSIHKGHLGEWNFSVQEVVSDDFVSEIPVYTIEDIQKELNGDYPDLIKMDIEGGENIFLKDDSWMSNILASSCFLVELHGFEAYLNYFKQLSFNKVKNAHILGNIG